VPAPACVVRNGEDDRTLAVLLSEPGRCRMIAAGGPPTARMSEEEGSGGACSDQARRAQLWVVGYGASSMTRAGARFGAQLLLFAVTTLVAAAPALAEGITYGHDDLRDDWYPEQSSLTPQLVSGGTFGQLWSTSVDGQVYAQPLFDNGNVLVATENNKVYLLNAATGATVWPQPLNLGTPWNPLDLSCTDLTPSIGVTGTPVIDSSTNTAYMTHKTYASGTSGAAKFFLDAIDLSKGTEKAGFPVELKGSAQNAPSISFEPTHQHQRPALLLMNGVIYAAFGSHCDHGTYEGWVFGISTAGQIKARWVDVPAEGDKAGIWMSGTGLVSDGPGRILFTTGNGTGPTTPAAGGSPPAALAESAVRLAVQPDGTLKPASFFAPFNAKELSEKDLDFASSGIAGLNDQYFGTMTFPHLAVSAGKEGYVYLLNREELGGFQQGMGGGDKVLAKIGPYGGVWAHPGVWPGEGGWIYIPTSYAGGVLRVYKYGLSGTGEPTISLQGTSSDSFGFGSSSAVITSSGTTAGSALVWILWDTDHTGTGAQLRAYDPVPVGGHPVLRWSAPIGTQSKFVLPGVGENRIYVGNREDKVMAFGAPVNAPLTGSPTEFPTTTIGSSSGKTTTLTATTSVEVKTLTSSNSQFTVGTTSPPLPAKLAANQTIKVPLTFKPTQTGTVAATLTAETSQGPASFSMSGTGQSAGAQLQTTPEIIAYGGVTVGSESSGSATFTNIGSAPLKINAEKLPSAPFSVSGMPAVGSEIQPGKSVTVTATFHPASEGEFHDEVGMETTGGNGAVSLSGSAGPPGKLKIESETNEYGEVVVGQTASKSFTITNAGGTNVSISKSKPPGGGQFAATTSLAEGTTIKPGETLTETVAFSPTVPGPANDAWQINGTDTTGLHEVKFSGIGAATFGKTSVGGSSDHFVAERKRVNRYALPAAGSVSKLSAYLTTGGTSGSQVLKGIIYADSSGKPGALVAVSEQLTYANTNATGWYDLKFGSPVKLAAGNYWIGVITGAPAGVTGFRFDSVSGSRDWNANTYTSGPSNPFGSVTTDSEQMSLYATYTPTPTTPVPVNETPPEIKGTPQQGQTLEELHGKWSNSPNPSGYTYQWLRCEGATCSRIEGATNQTYVLQLADAGHTIEVEETASNAGGSSKPAISAATATVAPLPPVDETAPEIKGTPVQGKTLEEVHGKWSNNPNPSGYTYHWLRCEGATCSAIEGATNQTYVPTAADVGHTIEVEETASNAGGPGKAATSAAVGPVEPPPPPAPVNETPPEITGKAQQGQTLEEVHGKWSNNPNPSGYTYQWLQCDSLGEACLPIKGATNQTYVLQPADAEHTIKVEETASNAGGSSAPATSAKTATVEPLPPVNETPPEIKGKAQQGQTLEEVHGKWSNNPNPNGFTYQWLRCEGATCSAIEAATKQMYVPVAADVGRTLKVEETASNAGGASKPASSSATAPVEPPGPPAPVNETPPEIKGTALQGQTLEEVHGKWSNSPSGFTYRWLQCDTLGESCFPIAGAASQTYVLQPADVGHTIRVEETASNAGGPGAPARSTQTGVVAGTFGTTSVGASKDAFAADKKRVNAYALGTAGSVSKLSIYLAPTTTTGQQVLKGVIYADASKAPGALLGVSEQLTFKNTNSAGWYDLTFASPVKLAAGSYWIGAITGATSNVAGFRYTSVASSRDKNSNTYTSGPSNPFGAVTVDSEEASLYAVYTPG
jgi:hypothetical protein